MSRIKLYDVVRVVRLRRPVEDYDGWGINRRSPKVGDTGVLVELLKAHDLPDLYVVESTTPDGDAIWISEFLIDEIEPTQIE